MKNKDADFKNTDKIIYLEYVSNMNFVPKENQHWLLSYQYLQHVLLLY